MARFLCTMRPLRVYSTFGIILISWATFVPNFVPVAATVAELLVEKNRVLDQSLIHPVIHPA